MNKIDEFGLVLIKLFVVCMWIQVYKVQFTEKAKKKCITTLLYKRGVLIVKLIKQNQQCEKKLINPCYE